MGKLSPTRIALYGAIALLVVLCACGGGASSSQTPPPSPPPPTPPALTITTDSLPYAVLNKPYSATLQGANGTPPYTWSVPAPYSLVTGLSLDAKTGVISGTPSSLGGVYTSIQVTDSATPSQTAVRNFFLDVYRPLTITGTLANAHLSLPYTSQILNAGQVGVTKWSVKSGTLPPGLALANNNNWNVDITGTPTQAGAFTFTIEAQDSLTPPQDVTQDFTLTVDTALKISTSSLKESMVGFPYSDKLVAVNGAPPLKWSASLPTGLVLNESTGGISGTPTQACWASVQVTVSDSSAPPQSDTKPVACNMFDRLRIVDDAVTLQQGTGRYLNSSGGKYPVGISASAGSLPPGMQISVGWIQASTAQIGTYQVMLTAQDSEVPPQTASKLVTVRVVAPLLQTGYASWDLQAVPDQPFHATLSAYGGQLPFTWSIQSGSMPPGITLDSSTGQLSGRPSDSGAYSFAAGVTDSASPPQHASLGCRITVRQRFGRNDTLESATSLGNGDYSASISPYADPSDTANPDSDYYRVMATAGNILSVGVYRGTSYAGNPLDPVLEILDANGARLTTCRNQGNTDGLTAKTVDPTPDAYDDLCVNDDIDLGVNLDSYLDLQVPGSSGALVPVYLHVLDWRGDARPDMFYRVIVTGAISLLGFSTTSLPDSAVGSDYYGYVYAYGGTAPYTFALASNSGPLPPGLVLGSDGRITGKPTVSGSYPFTIEVKDSGTYAQTASRLFTINVFEHLAITTQSLAEAVTGQYYNQLIEVAGGNGQVSFSYAAPDWPASIVFNNGVFSGIPDRSGSFPVTVSAASYSVNSSTQKTLNLLVRPGPLSILTSGDLPAATSGFGYSLVLRTSGGTPPIAWSVIAGTLPAGLALDPSTGDIYGIPTAAGVSTFTVQATDSAGSHQSATATLTINVAAAP